ncbi:hypothetical protein OH76DRAFT_1486393 [Lentinus brumalis]|uniref:DUF6533 domain-containing protein n=1 Tax=Lentinus brumalis TaxID=2498619 RepID=A0A371CYP8_9APHY|nr:hypothetical protein OH76DRAFT_1486393 [Polyporus brumalis]
MSLSAEAEAAELFAAFDSLRTSDWVAFASTAFLIYDYTLTLDREVRLFWTRRVTSVTVLYLVIRYSALTYVVLDALEPAPILSDKRCVVSLRAVAHSVTYWWCLCEISCLALFKVVDGIEAGRYIPLAAFSALRAYSLAKSHTISALIFISSLAPLAANLVQYGKGMNSVIIPINHLCVETDTFTPEDVVIALLVLNLLHLALSLAAVFGTTNGPSNVTLLIDPIMTILVARLMLDLQEANQRDVKLDSGDDLHFSQSGGSSSFVRATGSVRSIAFVDGGEEDLTGAEVHDFGSSHA